MKVRALIVTSVSLVSCGKDSSLGKLKADVGYGVLRPWDDQNDPDIKNAIGKLDGQCTAFHLGDGVVATAGHCLDEATQPADPCLSHQIVWPNGERSQCVQVLDYVLSEDRDLAVFEVDPIPEGSLEIASQYSGREGTTVIGYPKDEVLHISQDCESQALGEDKIEHNCHTLPGHSGSPLIREQDFKVIGIHNGHKDHRINYGSFLPDFAEINRRWQSARQEREQALSWGPFANNVSRLLYHIPSSQGEVASFQIHFNVEDGYDFVEVQDGDRVKHRLTGQGSREFELPTPVLVTFESDYGGESEGVSMQRIEPSS